MRRFLVVLVLAAGMAFVARPAAAVSWGPNATYYDGTRRATGWGSFYNSGNTYARNHISVRDDRRDGNTVYGSTRFFFLVYSCNVWGEQCTNRWKDAGRLSTPEISNTTGSWYHSKALWSSGSRVRVATQACAQMGWPVPDSCAASAIPSFSY